MENSLDLEYQEQDHTLLLETICELKTSNIHAKEELKKQSKRILEYEDELKTLRLKYNQSKQALLTLVETTCRREDELKQIDATWKCRIDNERNERNKMNEEWIEQTKQLEDWKRNIQMEMEQKYSSQIDSLMNEIQEEHTKRFQIKREFELFRVQKEVELDAAIRNATMTNDSRVVEDSTLKLQIAKFIESDALVRAEMNKLRSDLNRSEVAVRQATVLEKELTSQIETLQDENKTVKHEKMQMESQYESKIQELTEKLAALSAKLESKCHDIKHTNQELLECKELLKSRNERIQSTEEELKKAKTTLVERDRDLSQLKEEYKDVTEKGNFKTKQLIALSQKEKDSILRQKHDLQLRVQELERELEMCRTDKENKVEELKRNLGTALNAALLKNAKHEQRVTELENTIALERHRYQVDTTKWESFQQEKQYELDMALTECHSLRHVLKCKEDIINNMEQDLSTLRENMVTKEKDHLCLLDQWQDAQDQIMMLQNTIASTTEDARRSEMEIETLKTNLNHHIEKSKKSELEWKRRLETEMKRSRGYKEQCLEAHAREKLKRLNLSNEQDAWMNQSF